MTNTSQLFRVKLIRREPSPALAEVVRQEEAKTDAVIAKEPGYNPTPERRDILIARRILLEGGSSQRAADGIVARRWNDKAALDEVTLESLDEAISEALRMLQANGDYATAWPLPWIEGKGLRHALNRRGQPVVEQFDRMVKNEETGEKEPQFIVISSPWGVRARLKYLDCDDVYGLRVMVEDFAFGIRSVDFPRADFSRVSAADIKAALYAAGLRFQPGGEKSVVDALKAADPSEEILVVSCPGWHTVPDLGPVFACPDGRIVSTMEDLPVELSVAASLDEPHQAGTLDGWQEGVKAVAEAQRTDCPHFTIGLLAGLAGPVLTRAGMDSCGISLSGLSSRGKTTAQKLAASVWGNPKTGRGLMQTMRATANAAEALAARASGTVLLLDDLSLADGREVADLIYALCSGRGKSRMSQTAELKKSYTWQTFIFLSGEKSLEEKVRADGASWSPGMAVRIADIDITEVPTLGHDLMARINHCQDNFGHAGHELARVLLDQDPDELRDNIAHIACRLAGDNAPSQLQRAAIPFAVLQIAGDKAETIWGRIVDHEAAVDWAWAQYRDSSDAAALDPDETIVANIRAWCARNWAVTIKELFQPQTNNRDTLAWFDESRVYIPSGQIEEAAGGAFKPTQIGKALDRKGAIATNKKGRRTVQYVKGIGKGSFFVLKRDEVGVTSHDLDDTDEPEPVGKKAAEGTQLRLVDRS